MIKAVVLGSSATSPKQQVDTGRYVLSFQELTYWLVSVNICWHSAAYNLPLSSEPYTTANVLEDTGSAFGEHWSIILYGSFHKNMSRLWVMSLCIECLWTQCDHMINECLRSSLRAYHFSASEPLAAFATPIMWTPKPFSWEKKNIKMSVIPSLVKGAREMAPESG